MHCSNAAGLLTAAGKPWENSDICLICNEPRKFTKSLQYRETLGILSFEQKQWVREIAYFIGNFLLHLAYLTKER